MIMIHGQNARGGGLWLVLGLSLLVGCAPSPTPPWVSNGAGQLMQDDPSSMYGVGSMVMKGGKNVAGAWDLAETRARTALRTILEARTRPVMQAYEADTSTLMGRSRDDIMVERGVKAFSAMMMQGVSISDRHQDFKTKTFSVVVRLTQHDFHRTLADMQGLNPKLRDYLQQHAAQFFEKMEPPHHGTELRQVP